MRCNMSRSVHLEKASHRLGLSHNALCCGEDRYRESDTRIGLFFQKVFICITHARDLLQRDYKDFQ